MPSSLYTHGGNSIRSSRRDRISLSLFKPIVWVTGLDAFDFEVEAGNIVLDIGSISAASMLLTTDRLDAIGPKDITKLPLTGCTLLPAVDTLTRRLR